MTKRKSDSPTHLQAAKLIRQVCEAIESEGYDFLIIGGQAVIRHGHIRTTQDVDITVVATPVDEADRVLKLLGGLGLESTIQDPLAFAKASSLIRCVDPQTGFGVDVSFVDSDYLKQAVRRVLRVDTHGYSAPYLGLEDLIIHKTIAGRPQDHIDAVELMARYPDFDCAYVEYWLAEFETVVEKPLGEAFRAWRDVALA